MFTYCNMNHISRFSRFIPNKRFDILLENTFTTTDIELKTERFVADEVMTEAKLKAYEEYVAYLNTYIEELEYYIFFELSKLKLHDRKRRHSV